MRSRAVVGVVVIAALAAAFLLGRDSSGETCGPRELRVDGDCEAIEAGTPATPDSEDRAEYIASVAIDQDPPARALFAHCGFQGIAAGRVDVHLCVVHYHAAPVTMRLTNERGSRRFRVTVVSAAPARNPIPLPDAGDSFECRYEHNICPIEQSGG